MEPIAKGDILSTYHDHGTRNEPAGTVELVRDLGYHDPLRGDLWEVVTSAGDVDQRWVFPQRDER